MPSFSRAQSDRFAAQGARERREVNGTLFTWSGAPGKTLCGAFSAVRSRREIEAGGFEQQPDFIARVDVAAFPWFLPTIADCKAALGSSITIDGETYMIVEVAPLILGGERFLGLGKP